MNYRNLFLACVFASCGAMALIGCDKQPDATAPKAPAGVETPTTAPSTEPSTQASAPENTKCPVSGDPIDPKDASLDRIVYKDKTYAFCCKDCKGQFVKDPEKAIASLASAKPADSTPMNMDKK